MTAIGLSTDQRSNSRLIWKLFSSLSKVQIKLAFSTWFHMSMFQEFVILLVEELTHLIHGSKFLLVCSSLRNSIQLII